MTLTEKSCATFISELGSNAPVPGGGGAAALVGAVGVALGNMVAALTVGKKTYAAVQEEMTRLAREATILQNRLLELIQADADVFVPLSQAYRMPVETEDQREEKERVMERALLEACGVPLEIMKACGQAILLHEAFAEKGSKLAVSDAGVGVVLCKGALQGAALNVYINTGSMKDREMAAKLNQEADALIETYAGQADRIYASVLKRLK